MPRFRPIALLAAGLVACEGPSLPSDEYVLQDEVEVIRDSLGVVHIRAENDLDLFYASGYMQAYDRLFQMDLTRRRALGRRAEVLGPSAVADDTIVRVVGIERWAREAARIMRDEHPEDYRLLVAWTAGVNARIDEVLAGEAPLPYGFGPDELDYLPERWDPVDGIAVGKLILFGNANLLEPEILATVIRDFQPEAYARIPLMAPVIDAYTLPPDERPVGGMASAPIVHAPPRELPRLPPDAAERLRERLFDVVPSLTAQFASNNWALDGLHTENGRPLIAGDPHQPLRSPSLFWMQHLNSADAGGRFDVVGFSFVGTPTVQLGHNRHIAWTATTTYPDVSDIWDVRVTGGEVHVGSERVAIERREEVIEVAGREPVTIVVEEVPGYGVLLPDEVLPLPLVGSGRRVLYRWVGMQPTFEGEAFLAIDRAETLEDFEAAVDRMELGCFNWLAASADGIAYRSSPLVPDRGPDATSRTYWALLDGDDPSTFWTGSYLGPDRLPRSRGGARGWIATANNDPFGFTADGTTEGDPFYFGVFFDPGTRAARIEERLVELTEAGRVTVADMKALQMDSHSVFADLLVPVLEEVWGRVPTDEALAEYRDRPELAQLADVILSWDRRMVRDSSGAVAFDLFLYFAGRGVLEDDLPLVFSTLVQSEPAYVLKWAVLALRGDFPRASEVLQGGRDRLVMKALEATATFLEGRFGGVDPSLYRWGDYHGSRFRSEWGERLDGGWISNDGGIGTVNVSSASWVSGGGFVERLESTGGPLFRIVASFDEDGVPRAEVTVARGSSGDPESPFFANTTEDWVEGNYRPLLFDRDAIERDAAERLVLSP